RRRLPTVPPEDADRDDAGSARADARVLCAVALGRNAVDRPRLACRRHPAARRGRTQYPDVDVARARTDRGRAADRATALGRVHRAPTRRRGRDGGERLMSVLIVLVVMLTLLLIRVPVGFAIAIAGVFGLFVHGGLSDVLGVLQSAPATAVSSYSLSPIPLFILMAQFVVASGVMDDLFRATQVWVGRIRGGAGIAAAGAGAMFAAVSGSSTAAAATLAHTSTTKMIDSGYSSRISTGLVAVVGTLAALVPPSIILVFYAVIAEESVGQVLVAG